MNPIHLAYRLAQHIRLLYWRVAKPEVYGVKMLAFNDADDLLLIHHSYGRSELFMLPGGGIESGEEPAQAAIRELAEETGCRARDVQFLGQYLGTATGARNHVHVFTARTSDAPRIDGREITEARFFALDALPDTAAPSVLRRLADWRRGGPTSSDW